MTGQMALAKPAATCYGETKGIIAWSGGRHLFCDRINHMYLDLFCENEECEEWQLRHCLEKSEEP